MNATPIAVRLRLRDRHASALRQQSRAVNFVWNFCNETQRHAVAWGRHWPSAYDLQKLCAGTSKDLGLLSSTIDQVCARYERSRKQHRRPWLKWRGRKSLGWIPFRDGVVNFDGGRFRFGGTLYETMHGHPILGPGIKIRGGSFSADARGHWYLNICIGVECANKTPLSRIGIDLGLKSLAAVSNGTKIECPQFYRRSEAALVTSQRAKKTARVRRIHAKIRNRRKDFLHKLSDKLTKNHGLIVVGNVSPSNLAQTSMAKSIHDAGWYSLKRMLSYKSIRNGGATIEVNERNTSRTCSECGSIAGPTGRAGLNKRIWDCDCGAVHDRDVNAARNILRIGLNTLAEGAANARRSQRHAPQTEPPLNPSPKEG